MKYLPLCLMILCVVAGCGRGVSKEDLDKGFSKDAENKDKKLGEVRAELKSARDSFTATKDAVDGVEVRLNNMLEARRRELDILPEVQSSIATTTAVVIDDAVIAKIADAVAERNKPSANVILKEGAADDQRFIALEQGDIESFVFQCIRSSAAARGWEVRRSDSPQRAWHCRYIVGGVSFEMWFNARSETLYCQQHGIFHKSVATFDQLEDLRKNVHDHMLQWIEYAEDNKNQPVRRWPRGVYYYPSLWYMNPWPEK